jgi:hypothetical protein
MDPKGLLPQSEAPATSTYPEAQQSNPCLSSHFLKIHFSV